MRGEGGLEGLVGKEWREWDWGDGKGRWDVMNIFYEGFSFLESMFTEDRKPSLGRQVHSEGYHGSGLDQLRNEREEVERLTTRDLREEEKAVDRTREDRTALLIGGYIPY